MRTKPLPGGPPYDLIHAAAECHSSRASTVVTLLASASYDAGIQPCRPHVSPAAVGIALTTSKFVLSNDTSSRFFAAARPMFLKSASPVFGSEGNSSGAMPGHTTLPPASKYRRNAPVRGCSPATDAGK